MDDNFSILCIVTPFHGSMTMHLSFALPCTGMVQFVRNSHYYFGPELNVEFSVNLLKALLAIIATFFFFSSDAIILGVAFAASFGNQMSHHCKLMAVKLTFIMAFLFA